MPLIIPDIDQRRWKLDILDLTGGLNNSDSDENIEDNELSAVENYLPEHPDSKRLRKRPGLTAISSDLAENGQRIFPGKHKDYLCTLTKIQAVDGTDIETGLNSSTTWDAATFSNRDIFVNGTDEEYSTNGTSTTPLGGSPPNFKFIETHNNFVFGAGHSLGLLRWADLGTTETWSATNGLTLSTDEDDDITGMIKFRDVLMVFTSKRFFLINGFTTVDMEVVRTGHEGPGCTSNRSIVVTNAGIFWWSNQGLVASDDGITTDLPMQRKLKGTLDDLNEAQYANVHGVWNPLHDRVEYFVHTTGSSTVDLCIYYYYLTDRFWTGTGTGCLMNASGLVTISGLPTIYVVGYSGNANTDQVFSRVGNTDIDGNITALLDTKRFAPGGVTASLKLIDLTLKTGPVPANANITFGLYQNDETTRTDHTIAAITTKAENKIGFGRRLSKFKIRIGDSAATRPRIVGAAARGYLISD